jgi:Flp pilus assembly protein TadD
MLACFVLLGAGQARAAAPKPEDSIVLVRSINSLRSARGTGFAIGDGSWIITASHVVAADIGSDRRAYDRTVLVYSPWTGRAHEARVVAVDGAADLAALRVSDVKFPALPVEGLDQRDANAALSALRDRPLRLYGFPLAYPVATGPEPAYAEHNDSRLHGIRRRGETNLCVLNSCPDAQPGWSGGPILAADTGAVVGIFHSLYRLPGTDTAFPAGSLTQYLDRLLRQGGATDPQRMAREPGSPSPATEDGAERLRPALRSLSLSAQGKWHEAEAEQQQVVEADPDDPLARTELGRLLVEQDRLEEGLEHLREAERLAPRGYTPRYFLARALQLQGETTEAIRALQAANAASPDEQEPQLALAAVYAATERMDQAERTLRSALDRAPHHPLLMARLGELLLAREDQAGMKLLADASELSLFDPSLSSVAVLYGRALDEARRLKEAEAVYRKILRADPENAHAHHGIAVVLLREKRISEAQNHVNIAIALPHISDEMVEALRELQALLHEHAGKE